MTTLAVIGNCQARGIARSMRALLPRATVHLLLIQRLRGASDAEFAAHVETLKTCDTVFAQVPEAAFIAPLSIASLRGHGIEPIPLPMAVLPGLFPDMTMLTANRVRLVGGPFGARNPEWYSAIAAGAFLEGLSEARAVRLFNAYTYGSLGYFGEFDRSLAALVADADASGFDFRFLADARHVDRMHTVNHATIGTLHEVARQALRKIGIEAIGAAPAEDDPLDGAFPVYPELAARIGRVPPRPFVFGRRDGDGADGSIDFDLPTFVSENYRRLREVGGTFTSKPLERVRAFLRQRLTPAKAA